MKLLKMKITRIAAFLSACAIIAYCVFGISKTYLSQNTIHKTMPNYNEEFNGLMDQLWAVGVMYLRHIDANGSFDGSDELKKSTVSAMQELGLMDENGNITVNDYGMLKYSVSYGETELSNCDMNFEQLYDPDYSFTYADQEWQSYPISLGVWLCNEMSWHSTNYGMDYFYFGYRYNDGYRYNALNNQRGAAVFDFDTEGLDSYIDDYGVKIYYKTDGTTPLPFTQNIEYGDYDEYEYEPATEQNELPDKGFLIYDSDNEKWIHIDNEKFTNIPGQNMPLKICITPTSEIIAGYEEYSAQCEREKQEFIDSLAYMIPLAIAAAVLFLYFIIAGGYSISEKRFVTGSFEKWFAEFPIAVIAVAGAAAAALAVYPNIITFKEFLTEIYKNPDLTPILYSLSYTLLTAIVVMMLNTLIIRIKCRCLFKTSLIGRIIKKCISLAKKVYRRILKIHISRDMVRNSIFMRNFLMRTVAAIVIEILVILIGVSISFEIEVLFVLSILLLAAYIWLNLNDLRYLNGLEKQITDMNGGDYSRKDVPETAVTYTMTEKLNNISDGIQTAVENRIKSERMKIDLVTNVSHDLKTPLTSIISYIDLLSAEELEPAARDYVKILEQKSQRLSAIVADLFDLAKATSRTDINNERIDAVILVGQVLGDMSDKIERFGKEIRTRIDADSAPIMADGKKLYRVMQNLIDNALKYSLDNTRIWLSLETDGGNVVVRVKNTSSYEMSFSPEEITERFTRGDESRTTEGNGLGLSIAKSFAEACGGMLRISIDGDTFTAEVSFTLAD